MERHISASIAAWGAATMNKFLSWAESKQGMIVLGITAVLAIAIYIIRHGSGSVIAAPASNGGVTDMSAMPTGPTYTITSPPVSTPSSPSNPTPAQPVPPVGGNPITATLATVRQKSSIDTASSSGVPIRPSTDPYAAAIGFAPFGSQVSIGSTVQGPSNFGSAGGGSTTWYTVLFNGQQGYISAYDLA